MTRRTAADQRGMTLLETVLALGLSVMLVLPMAAWAQVAMDQQAAVLDQNLAGASLGTLRTYFLRDVATAHRAEVGRTQPQGCPGAAARAASSTPMMTLQRDQQRIVWSLAPNEDVAGDDGDDPAVGLWRTVCAPGGPDRAATILLVESVDPSRTEASCDAEHPATCRRIELRVTTPELDQVVLSAGLRVGGEVDDEELLPDVVIGAEPRTGPAPLEVRFTSTGSVDPRGGELTLHWDLGDGTTSTGPAPTHRYTRPGTYTATLTATNELGGAARASIQITVENRPPVAVIASPAEGTTVARGEPVAFSSAGSNDDADAARGGSIVAWHWDFGDGTSSIEASPVKAYDVLRPDGLVVTLTVTDGDGATATATTRVHVVNRIPTVQIVADRTSGDSPLTVRLSAIVVDETTMATNPPITYAWDLGDGTTSNVANPTVTYTGAGTRTVQLTVTDDAGATATATRSITVAAPAVAAPSNLRMTNSGVEKGKRFAELAWDRVANATRYEVRLECVHCTDTASAQESGTTLRIRDLDAARHTYTAQVRARDAAGNWGPWSSAITVRP